ncbi:MAG: bifunctional DNA-formamidopyrimidine glycosylase/DNA-(apurinic or apyrimidinic site) lyase [Roseiflexaceae bacterium]|nr:bifunctional DNA-formamidopyrimidine glycosylase/DNA-(apurinic or apyrimidinic site) lyase [Roseiflexaceae bacterium]
MPELPEVEHVARSLGAQITGAQIAGVTKLDWERMIETPDLPVFLDLIAGRAVRAVGRRAKWIVVTLDAGLSLALHLRMSGFITVRPPDDQPDGHTHLVLALEDGRQVFFHDTRKFGRVRLIDSAGLSALESAHGVEPLSEEFTHMRLAALLRSRRTKIKPLLLDQKLIAGIGNIYADEALWRAQIHPLRQSDTLNDEEIARLHTALRDALEAGLANGGSTLRDYRNSFGERGTNQDSFNVYDQRGKPCPRCATPIVKTVVAQRGTHFCPKCQPA